MKAPESYAEWADVLDALASRRNDAEVLSAMQAGTLPWQSGVAERFARRLIDTVNGRMNAATDQFQKSMSRSRGHYFYNLVFMPTIRFTYFHHEYVNLYSGIGIGMDINGGTETNAKGQRTEVGAAVNITVFGVSANYKRWFWTVDFGGLYALKNANAIYMASSRIINVGLGARF